VLYNVLRGCHILAIIAWMAGLLYLPRLFVYHTRAQPGSELDTTFQMMEHKLLRVIMAPAAAAVFLLGGALVWYDGTHGGWAFLHSPWMLLMAFGALALVGWQVFLERSRRSLSAGRRDRSERFWRLMNEAPFLIAVIIVLAATTKFGA
jgi:putative membrane protein